MKRFLVYLTSILIGAFGAFGIAVATQPDPEHKVTICHRTNSVTNPYVKLEVDESAVDGEGQNDHTQHTGPVATSQERAQELKDSKTKWGDIIPDKLNWTDEGQAIYRNDCKYPDDEGGRGGGSDEGDTPKQESNEVHPGSLPTVGADGL